MADSLCRKCGARRDQHADDGWRRAPEFHYFAPTPEAKGGEELPVNWSFRAKGSHTTRFVVFEDLLELIPMLPPGQRRAIATAAAGKYPWLDVERLERYTEQLEADLASLRDQLGTAQNNCADYADLVKSLRQQLTAAEEARKFEQHRADCGVNSYSDLFDEHEHLKAKLTAAESAREETAGRTERAEDAERLHREGAESWRVLCLRMGPVVEAARAYKALWTRSEPFGICDATYARDALWNALDASPDAPPRNYIAEHQAQMREEESVAYEKHLSELRAQLAEAEKREAELRELLDVEPSYDVVCRRLGELETELTTIIGWTAIAQREACISYFTQTAPSRRHLYPLEIIREAPLVSAETIYQQKDGFTHEGSGISGKDRGRGGTEADDRVEQVPEAAPVVRAPAGSEHLLARAGGADSRDASELNVAPEPPANSPDLQEAASAAEPGVGPADSVAPAAKKTELLCRRCGKARDKHGRITGSCYAHSSLPEWTPGATPPPSEEAKADGDGDLYAALRLAAEELRRDMVSSLVTVPRETLERFIANAIQREAELETELEESDLAELRKREAKLRRVADSARRMLAFGGAQFMGQLAVAVAVLDQPPEPARESGCTCNPLVGRSDDCPKHGDTLPDEDCPEHGVRREG